MFESFKARKLFDMNCRWEVSRLFLISFLRNEHIIQYWFRLEEIYRTAFITWSEGILRQNT